MTNEQLYLLLAGQGFTFLMTVVAVFLAAVLGGRGIQRQVDLTNRRMDHLRKELVARIDAAEARVNGRIDTLTAELRQGIQYTR